MRRSIATAVLFVAAATGCDSHTTAPVIVELLVLPTSYTVDGEPHQTAVAAVEAALKKEPAVLNIPACSLMPTQRVIQVAETLQGRFSGQVVISSLPPGERGCPGFARE